MDNKKFEQLIDLIVNENEEQARALFHDIVVEKSREIYESMMDMDEGLGGQVGQMLDELEVEESGMMEADDEDFDDEELGVGDDGVGSPDDMPVDDESLDKMGNMDDADMDAMDADAEGGEEDLEDRVVDLEEKLDQLMAEFEEIMNGEEGEEDFDAGEEEEAAGEEDEAAGEEEEAAGEEEEEESELAESKLIKVPAVHHPASSGNDKSIARTQPGFKHGSANPVNFGKGAEGGSHGNVKVQELPGVANVANKGGKTGISQHAVARPKAVQSAQNTRSPVAESKRVASKPVATKRK